MKLTIFGMVLTFLAIILAVYEHDLNKALIWFDCLLWQGLLLIKEIREYNQKTF